MHNLNLYKDTINEQESHVGNKQQEQRHFGSELQVIAGLVLFWWRTLFSIEGSTEPCKKEIIEAKLWYFFEDMLFLYTFQSVCDVAIRDKSMCFLRFITNLLLNF